MSPVLCPNCRGTIPPTPHAAPAPASGPKRPAWAPFCSRRCQLADLHKWFGGEYAIASHGADEGDGDEVARAADDDEG